MTTTSAHPSERAHQPDWGLVAFLGIAYGIAWGLIPVLELIARQSALDGWLTLLQMVEAGQFEALAAPGWIVYGITRLMDFSFSIAGVIMIAVLYGREGLRDLFKRLLAWRFRPIFWVLGLLPVIFFVISLIVAGALPSFTFSGAIVAKILFSLEAGLLVSLFLRGAMGEELGLRGFALPRLQQTMSPFKASLVIGALWGLWHLPVLLGRDVFSLAMFLVLSFGLAFTFTYLFNGSGGSLIPVLLFHATQNAEEVYETLFPALVGTEWELISTILLFITGIVAAVLVWRSSKDKASRTTLART